MVRLTQLIRPGQQACLQKTLTATLALGLLIQPILLPAAAMAASTDGGFIKADARVTVVPTDIQQALPVNGADRLVNMSLYDVSVSDALRALAKQGGFNVLIDESVSGTVSLDLNNVKLQDALDTLKNYGKLAYSVDGNKLMVASADSERGKSFNRAATRVVPLKYANARILSDLLNATVFAPKDATAGSSNTQKVVTPDFQTNSLVVVGTVKDIQTAEKHINALDVPREVRTWRLSHANAVDVAAQLSASLFNEGIPAMSLQGGGSGGSASTGTGGAAGQTQIRPASLRVATETIQEGEGSSEQSASGEDASTSSQITLRGRVKENSTVQISPQGPILMPDTRLNSITLMGTAQQISLAESMIATLDRKAPQVVLEASLIEVKNTDTNSQSYNFGVQGGKFSFGANNLNAFTNPVGMATAANQNMFRWATNPVVPTFDFYYQMNAMIQNEKAKLLANPTVVTAHDSETVISIVDEFIRRVEITTGQLGGTAGSDVEIADYGVVLNILPRIGADGSVNMRIKPSISTLQSTPIVDPLLNVTQLKSKREIVAQNIRLQDGESFVLGGLVNETDTDAIGKIPGLANLPILGALARSSSKAKNRTELLIVITPHVINDESDAARVSSHHPMRPAIISNGKSDTDGFIPVSNTGTMPYSTPSRLPGLLPVHVLGGNGTPAPQSMLMRAPEETSPALKGEMSTPAPEPAAATSTGASFATAKAAATSATSRPFQQQAGPISDDQIRSLIDSLR